MSDPGFVASSLSPFSLDFKSPEVPHFQTIGAVITDEDFVLQLATGIKDAYQRTELST